VPVQGFTNGARRYRDPDAHRRVLAPAVRNPGWHGDANVRADRYTTDVDADARSRSDVRDVHADGRISDADDGLRDAHGDARSAEPDGYTLRGHTHADAVWRCSDGYAGSHADADAISLAGRKRSR
jgi:hypothetical protein